SMPVVDAIAGKAYKYAATAVDPESDPLTFALEAHPQGMSIDAASGALTWAPAASDIGTHDVTVRVSDGRGGVAEQRYGLTVGAAPPNRPPIIISTPVTTATVATSAVPTYRYEVRAT